MFTQHDTFSINYYIVSQYRRQWHQIHVHVTIELWRSVVFSFTTHIGHQPMTY